MFETAVRKMPPELMGKLCYVEGRSGLLEATLTTLSPELARIFSPVEMPIHELTPAEAPLVEVEREALQAKEVEELGKFEDAKRFFEEHRQEILASYRNKYVAIWENKIVDSDHDFGALADRVYSIFGYHPIYMPFVAPEPRMVRIPSPRVSP